MIDKLVIEDCRGVKKVACLDNGNLVEFYVVDKDKANEGNIYLGKIIKKIKTANGKTGYFINIGSNRDAFINAEEKYLEDLDALEGQDVIVQVSQEQRAEKGARLVRFLRLAGVYLVYDPYGESIEVSDKIDDEDLSDKLLKIVSENSQNGGFVIRTAAKNASEKDIVNEIKYLESLFDSIIDKAKKSKSPDVLYIKDNIIKEILLRESTSVQKIVVNTRIMEDDLSETGCVEYDKDAFKNNGIDEMLAEALQKEIKLKCGGRVIIEETKAFVAVDVDSGEGCYQGGLTRLNMEASEEIAKQIILRNLSGKIIIDFAGFSDFKFLKSAIDVLENNLAEDTCKARVLGLSRGGNVEIIRNRRRPSLRDLYSVDCPTCFGTGRVEK